MTAVREKDLVGEGPRARKWGGPVAETSRAGSAGPADTETLARVQEIIDKGPSGAGALIPLLQAVQAEVGYLPRVAVRLLSRKLGVPESKIYGVATFYAQFHMKPRGRYVIRVCQGTACHVRGGKSLLEAVKDHLGIEPGDTTSDLTFTLERVACLGACGLAPTMIVNEDTYGRLTPAKAQKLLDDLAKGKAAEAGRPGKAGDS